jgi:GWxTD domain-containing protein
MRFSVPVLALALCAILGTVRVGSAGTSRAEQASKLFASARDRLARGSHEQRQRALTELQDALLLDPDRNDIALTLGRLYLEADLLSRARDVARRLVASDTTDAAVWLLDGEVWRRYWLTTIDETARDHAIMSLAHSARLAPGEAQAWFLLAPLLVDVGELESARSVAAFAGRAAPTEPIAQLLIAATAQRVGDLATAERLFQAAVPRLPPKQRERYEDVAPLLPLGSALAYQQLSSAARARYGERVWADNDPDPVSVENEARLEYWARVTQALMLYGTSRAGEWDMRAQYYVRFGPPTFEELNPIRKPESLHRGDWLAWTYTDLGLRVWMGTSSVIFGFSEGISGLATMARASPDSLARRGELAPLAGGYAVFHRLPPGVTALDTRLAVARFQSDDGIHLFAQAESPGALDDRFTASWVVLDSLDTAVARGTEPMSASACRAEQARSASFATPLAPGRYRVGVQVSDTLGRRGIARRGLVTVAPERSLAMSDLVVVCGSPAQSVVAGPAVRLEPQTGLYPAEGDQLNVYFEIYNLKLSAGGAASYRYDCVVSPLINDRRGWLSRLLAPLEGPPPIEVNRSETTVGALRRQFLQVPVAALPTGTYQISVVVRDLGTNATANAVASFERRR